MIRRKILIFSFLNSLFLFSYFYFASQFYFFLILLQLLFLFVGTGWIFSWRLKFWEYLILPLLPSFLTLLFIFNLFWLPSRGFLVLLGGGKEKFIFFFFLLTFLNYFLFLLLNILNVATVRIVPLKKAALNLLLFSSFWLVFQGWGLLFQLINWGNPGLERGQFFYGLLLIWGIALPFLWFVQEERFRLPWRELLVLGFILVQLDLVLLFAPLSSGRRALVLSGTFLVLLNLLGQRLQYRLSRRVLGKHLLFWFLLILFLL